MIKSKRTLSMGACIVVLSIAMTLILFCSGIAWGSEEDEYDEFVAPVGESGNHWWVEEVWKKGVNMDGKGIAIKYIGSIVYINYIKFIPVGSPLRPPVTWTDFESLTPKDALTIIRVAGDYKDLTKWAINKGNMADVGGQTLYAVPGDWGCKGLPILTFFPKIEGVYDIYIGTRAVHWGGVKVGLCLVEE